MNPLRLPRQAALVLALLGSGCETAQVEESSIEEHRFALDPDHPRIVVRLQRGSIEAVATQETDLGVVIRKTARDIDRGRARARLDAVRVPATQEQNSVRVEAPLGLTAGIRTDVTLEIPRETELDLRTGDGRIELHRVNGHIDAETGDGRIRLEEVSGTLRLRSGDGSVTGTGVTGNLDVLTDDGRIELEGVFGSLRAVSGDGSIRVRCTSVAQPSENWTLRSSNGSIAVRFPPDFSASLDATSADGNVVNKLPGFEGVEMRERVRGTLGAGGPLVLIVAMDGNVTLEND